MSLALDYSCLRGLALTALGLLLGGAGALATGQLVHGLLGHIGHHLYQVSLFVLCHHPRDCIPLAIASLHLGTGGSVKNMAIGNELPSLADEEAAPLLEVPDALISAVIEHDHRERQTLLDCGHQFLAGHEERGIADKDNNLPLGHGQSGSQSCGDFESHGGVSVLHKIPLALRVFVFPQPVQVTGEASGGIDDDGPIACVTVDDIDGCGLIDGHSVAIVVAGISGHDMRRHRARSCGGDRERLCAARVERGAGRLLQVEMRDETEAAAPGDRATP